MIEFGRGISTSELLKPRRFGLLDISQSYETETALKSSGKTTLP